MAILIVDDSPDSQLLISEYLKAAGYKDIIIAQCAKDAYQILGINAQSDNVPYIDLIMMDIVMPETSGIEACKKIKNYELYFDTPIIMVTAKTDSSNLKAAFEAGATDYITKPINKVELLSRVNSAVKLKYEIDRRKARELDLIQLTRKLKAVNEELKKLTSLDGLTGIANRRHFDYYLETCWKKHLLTFTPIALIMYDIDCFKIFNDTYGHLYGDECLKQTAAAVNKLFENTSALTARYGGEEFCVIMPETDIKTAAQAAEKIRITIENLAIPHINSKVKPLVTVSVGVASLIPTKAISWQDLIGLSDQALYKAKQNGRNQIAISLEISARTNIS